MSAEWKALPVIAAQLVLQARKETWVIRELRAQLDWLDPEVHLAILVCVAPKVTLVLQVRLEQLGRKDQEAALGTRDHPASSASLVQLVSVESPASREILG